MGDSITWGWYPGEPWYTPYGGYRGHLWDRLWTEYDVRPVGSQPGPAQYGGHEGVPGRTIQGTRDALATILAATCPDLVLLVIGTNDGLQSGWSFAGLPFGVPGGLIEQLAALLVAINHEAPDRLTLVGTIPPVGSVQGNGVGTAWATTWNTACLHLALQQARSGGARCRLVDVGGPLVAADLLGDGLHPNDAGYRKMADNWYRAIVGPPAPLRVCD